MISEKIGTTELSAFGLKLGNLDGNNDLPAFKNVIYESSYGYGLKYLDEKTVKIRLVGIYANKQALSQNVENFKTKIRENIKQTWTFTNHGFQKLCVVKDGIRVDIFGGMAVEIYITLTETIG